MPPGRWRKILLFALIFGVPLSFILFFSSGKHEFRKLRYWGEHSVDESGDTTYYYVNDFSLTTTTGQKVSLSSFADKILIVMVLSPQCPDNCAIQADKFKLLVYDELVGSPKKFHDVAILAHVKDYYTDSIPDVALIDRYFNTDTAFMKLVTGTTNPLYDFKPHPDGANLLNDEHAGIPGQKGYHQYALLIDKERHVRGVYDLSHSQRIRTLMEELRILKKEYTIKENT
jgi:protein SCO1/2